MNCEPVCCDAEGPSGMRCTRPMHGPEQTHVDGYSSDDNNEWSGPVSEPQKGPAVSASSVSDEEIRAAAYERFGDDDWRTHGFLVGAQWARSRLAASPASSVSDEGASEASDEASFVERWARAEVDAALTDDEGFWDGYNAAKADALDWIEHDKELSSSRLAASTAPRYADEDDKWYWEVMGGVPWDHWGAGCTDDCLIPQHKAFKEGLAHAVPPGSVMDTASVPIATSDVQYVGCRPAAASPALRSWLEAVARGEHDPNYTPAQVANHALRIMGNGSSPALEWLLGWIEAEIEVAEVQQNRSAFGERILADLKRAHAALASAAPTKETRPIPAVLFCPSCLTRHVDEGEWATKPHRTHLCASCGSTWRAAPVPTVGVADEPTKETTDGE